MSVLKLNIKRGLILLIIVISTSQSIYAFDYKAEVCKIISRQYGNAASEPSIMMGYNHLAIIQKDTFIVPNGYHYVFKLNNGVPIRQDQSTFHGSNFGRFLFTYNKSLYALGGYGFFNTNNNLEYYNSKLKGWAVEKTIGIKPKHILGVTYKTGNEIISFNNIESGNSIDKDKLDSNLYLLDLTKMRWSRYCLNELACQVGRVFYLKDFVISIGEIKTVIVNTKLKSFSILENEKFGLDIIHNQIMKIDKNSIYVNTFSNHKKEPLNFEINIEKIWGNLKKYSLQIEKRSINKSNILTYVIVGFMSALLFLIFLLKIRKKTKPNSNNKHELSDIEKRLINSKEILNTDELDEIFGISHLDVDAKKLKRSRMIDDINSRFTDLIVREKDQNDKRKFVYRIKNEL